MKKQVALGLLLSLPIWAHALSLEEAQSTGEQNSHQLHELSLMAESAQWGEKHALAAFLPKLDLGGQHLVSERFQILELNFAGSDIAFPEITPYSDFGLQARWNVFDGGHDANALAAAKLDSEAANLRLRSANNHFRAEVRATFYRALGQQLLINVAEENAKTLEEHLTDIKARVRSGVSTRFDQLRIEVQLEEAQTEVTAASDRSSVARSQLFRLIAKDDDGKPLLGALPEDWNTFDLAKVTLDMARREDREAQRLSVEREHKNYEGSRAHWLPQVDLFGSQDWYNNSNHSLMQDDNRFKSAYSYGVMLKWNLFDGGASMASQRQAALGERMQYERLAELDQNIPADVDEAKRRLAYDISTYKTRLSSVRKAEEAVRLAKSGLREGVRTNTEVLDAVVDLNRAKATAVRTQMDAVDALGKLEIALGRPLDIKHN